MERSEKIGSLSEALAKAQGEMTLPGKNREVKVKLRDNKGEYKFEYTTLDHMIEHVRAPLTKNGLWFIQTVASDNGKPVLDTTLTHSSGEWVTGRMPLVVGGGDNANQAFGSALTYMRRYALAAMLGIASEDDDDGNAAEGNTIAERKDKPRVDPLPPLQRPKQANGNGTHKDDKAAAMKWVQDSEIMVAKFGHKDLLAWETKNTPTMERLKVVDIDMYDRIKEAVRERFVALSPLNA